MTSRHFSNDAKEVVILDLCGLPLNGNTLGAFNIVIDGKIVWCSFKSFEQCILQKDFHGQVRFPYISIYFDCLFDLLLYIHSKQLRSCQDSHLLNDTVPGQVFHSQFTSTCI